MRGGHEGLGCRQKVHRCSQRCPEDRSRCLENVSPSVSVIADVCVQHVKNACQGYVRIEKISKSLL